MYVPSYLCTSVYRDDSSSCIVVALSYLQPSIKCPLNGHTLAGMGSVGGDSCDEGVKLIFFLLQLFHQALNGPLGKSLTLTTLSVAHQTVHNAQAGVVAGRSVGDRHFEFLSLTALSENMYVDTVSHHQEAGEKTIFTGLIKSQSAVIVAGV